MRLNDILIKLKEKKYLVVMLVLGVMVMLIPWGTEKNSTDHRIYSENTNKIEVRKLEKTINKINGVKSCNVFVTYENEGENNYVYDVSGGSNRQIEVKINDDKPLLKSVKNPEVRGMFVYVEGAINEDEIVYIVKAATGVPMHRIYVKMSREE